tara:strand:- start:814 stop:1062 length:249 start_codon:yes stop_codon:yes gene_type:complete
MNITNNEYDIIIRAIDSLVDEHKELDSYVSDAKLLKEKLMKEYERIAKKNIEEGMTQEEEELYPSRLNSEYGGSTNDYNKVE